MAVKPNMRMGGINPQGNSGVLNSINQAARIESVANKTSPLETLGGDLSDWADDEMKAAKAMALQKRKEKFSLGQEERKAAREDAKWEAGAGNREADKKLKEAKTSYYEGKASGKSSSTSGSGERKLSPKDKYDLKQFDKELDLIQKQKMNPDIELTEDQLAELSKREKVLKFKKEILWMTPEQRAVKREEMQAKLDAKKAEEEAKAKEEKLKSRYASKSKKVNKGEVPPADRYRIVQEYSKGQPMNIKKIREIYQAEQLKKEMNAGSLNDTMSRTLGGGNGVLDSALSTPKRLF